MPPARALRSLRVKLVGLLPPKQAVWLRVVRVALRGSAPPPPLPPGPHSAMAPAYGPGVMLPPPAMMMRPMMVPVSVDPGYIESLVASRMQQMAVVIERMVGGRLEAGLGALQVRRMRVMDSCMGSYSYPNDR